MKAHTPNSAPLSDPWLEPDDGPWCDNCNQQLDDCTCHDDDNEVTSLDDGFGNVWEKCDRPDCGLQIVRPGSAQCDTCDDDE